ncbi:MAG TPA: aldolase/citrate lyase family protein [Gaiellaceae bacterium]
MNDGSFASRVRARELLVGTFISSASPAIAEAAATGGLDWLIVDLEHGVSDGAAANGIVRSLSPRLPVLVRTPPDNPHAAELALDAGATGIMLPRMESADEAGSAFARTSYAHSRGLARAVAAWDWGAKTGDPLAADAQIVRIAQIETVAALAAAEAIAALPLVDALFLGAVDLALDARRLNATVDAEDAAARVAAAAARAGKAAGAMIGAADQVEGWHARGFSLLACSADVRIVAEHSARVAVEAARVRKRLLD